METLGDEVAVTARYEISRIPFPVLATVTRVYEDSPYVDVKSDQYGEIPYIEIYGSAEVGDTVILLFLDNTTENRVIIGHGGSTDLTQLTQRVTNLENQINGLEEDMNA